jgi:hypothetical protein
MKTNFDLTLDICTENGSRTRFHQHDQHIAENIVRVTVSPPLETIGETALSADLMQSIRS